MVNDLQNIRALLEMHPDDISKMLSHEHPQVIAVLLCAANNAEKSAQILSKFAGRLRNDVILRMTTCANVQSKWMVALDKVIAEKIARKKDSQVVEINGMKEAGMIVRHFAPEVYEDAIASVRDYDPELAGWLKDEMFEFKNLVDLDDRSIQLLLREVQSEALLIALRGTTQELQDKIFSNMSSVAADMMRVDLIAKGPVHSDEVKTEQREIVKVIFRLVDEGTIAFNNKQFI